MVSILPNLELFRIIAKQPVEAKYYWNAPTLEQQSKSWIIWVTAYFVCFNRYLSTTSRVERYDDNGEEAGSLVDRHLPPTYQKLRLRSGDTILTENSAPGFGILGQS